MEDLLLRLQAEGVDVDEVIRRLGSTKEKYLKYVLTFFEQDSLPSLKAAIAESDVESADGIIHTIKGLSLTLGIKTIFDIVNDMTVLLHENKTNEAFGLFPLLEESFNRIYPSDCY